jgi:N-acetylglucosamine-6-phosphate deacetylase
MLFLNARLILSDRVIPQGSLRIANGKIVAVATENLTGEPGEEIVDLAGKFLAPGFIDLHIHGAVHRDSMEADPAAYDAICRHHASGGTTALALTTVTATSESILATLEGVRSYRERTPVGARVLGVHIEGPYFSLEKPGAHQVALIRHPNPAEYEKWLAYGDCVTQMTFAPELPGSLDLIGALLEADVAPSGGHSDAWDEEAAEAFARGMRQVTHTFNCMSTTRRRGPFRVGGLLEFALSEPEIVCELIADARHVSPTLMRMLYQAKGPDGIALVTDAAAGAGLAEGETFSLGEIQGVVRDEVALTADGRALCSSTATMIRLVQNMVRIVEAPLHEAIRMASLVPARIQGMADRKGVLALEADADLVVLTDQLEVEATYVGGQCVFRRGKYSSSRGNWRPPC